MTNLPSSPPPLPSLSIPPPILSLFHSITNVHAALEPLFSLYSRSCFGLTQLFFEVPFSLPIFNLIIGNVGANYLSGHGILMYCQFSFKVIFPHLRYL